MRRWLIAPMVVLALAIIGGTLWVALQSDGLLAKRAAVPVAAKSFSTEVAEGGRLRDFEHFGVDLLSFGTCRIEKLRRGGITLGAFNVLVLDDVTINLMGPDQSIKHKKEIQPTDNTEAFIGLFKSVQGLSGKKISGVRISRLAVNRLTGGGTEHLFAAELAEGGLGSGKALRLKGCRVFTGGNRGELVHDARVEIESVPALAYRQSDGQEKCMPLQ